MKDYQIGLYYGWEENENYGVSHAFEVVDPKEQVDDGLIADSLAESLDVATDDYHFNYNSMYILLPESLVKRIKEDAVKEYLACKDIVFADNEKNMKVIFRYTDANNYHARNEAVIRGVLSPEQKQMILGCLNEGEFFVPGAIGLDVELPWEFDPQDDHPFWTLDEDSFEETTEKPTVNISAEEFVRAFEENKDKWEQLGVEYMLEYEGEFEPADIEDIINGATERSGCQVDNGLDKDIELV